MCNYFAAWLVKAHTRPMKLSERDQAWLVAMLAAALYWRARAARMPQAAPSPGERMADTNPAQSTLQGCQVTATGPGGAPIRGAAFSRRDAPRAARHGIATTCRHR